MRSILAAAAAAAPTFLRAGAFPPRPPPFSLPFRPGRAGTMLSSARSVSAAAQSRGGAGGAEMEVRAAQSGEIHVIVGPMFAGKTTALLRRVQAEASNGRSVALIKSDKDNRYALDSVVTHDGAKMPCWAISQLSSFHEKLGIEAYDKTALKTTPFQVVYGHDPPVLIPFRSGSSRVVAMEHQLQERDMFLAEIRERLLQAQDHMKNSYDEQHRALEFEVGDWVLLRLHQHAAMTLRGGAPSKLSPKYYGPYLIVERIGQLSCRLRLPPKSQVHDVFHVVFLKKFEGVLPQSPALLPAIVHGRAVPKPEKVLHARPTKESWELLVKCQDCAPADATWEPLEAFNS